MKDQAINITKGRKEREMRRRERKGRREVGQLGGKELGGKEFRRACTNEFVELGEKLKESNLRHKYYQHFEGNEEIIQEFWDYDEADRATVELVRPFVGVDAELLAVDREPSTTDAVRFLPVTATPERTAREATAIPMRM